MPRKKAEQVERRVLDVAPEAHVPDLSGAVAHAIGAGLKSVDMLPVTDYLSTGCTILDLAVADKLPGGFACGRITHVYGAESTGKTVLACEPLGAAQRKGGLAIFDDIEGTFDEDRASRIYGLNTEKNFVYTQSDTIEDMFDHVIRSACVSRKKLDDDNHAPWAIGIDSLSALTCMKEAEIDLKDATYGTNRAKMMSTAFRKYIGGINRQNIALIFVDQTRAQVGSPNPNAETTSGGRALKFYASTRVLLSLGKQIPEKGDVEVGQWFNFFVSKNKVAPPHRRGRFAVLYDYGIDDTWTNLEWLKDSYEKGEKLAIVSEAGGGGWCTYHPEGGKEIKAQGMGALAIKVEEAGLQKELVSMVEKRWREVYASEMRAPKVRE